VTVVDSTAAQALEEQPPDPRDPRIRLEALFDDGSLRLLTDEVDSGAIAGTGRI